MTSMSNDVEAYPWHCWQPEALAQRLLRVERPWCVVGGWALDLWHGRQTREHEDIEFTVLREDIAAFRQALAGISFYAAGDGQVAALAPDDAPPADIFQLWCLEDALRCWRADMMVEPGSTDTWAYKHDPRLTRPRHEMVDRTAAGIPYLRPAGVLLFKARHQRVKDEQDFEHALPSMPVAERAWLKYALASLYPGHDWLHRC